MANWDAAWVFIKWSTNNGYTWQHALLNPSASNHTAPSGSTIMPSADSIGVFSHRSENRISDRYFACYNVMNLSASNGFRHLRTAP